MTINKEFEATARNAYYYALQTNRHLFSFYKGGMTPDEFTRVNARALKKIITELEEEYHRTFNNKHLIDGVTLLFLHHVGRKQANTIHASEELVTVYGHPINVGV